MQQWPSTSQNNSYVVVVPDELMNSVSSASFFLLLGALHRRLLHPAVAPIVLSRRVCGKKAFSQYDEDCEDNPHCFEFKHRRRLGRTSRSKHLTFPVKEVWEEFDHDDETWANVARQSAKHW